MRHKNLEKRVQKYVGSGLLYIDRFGTVWRMYRNKSVAIVSPSKRGYIYISVTKAGYRISCSAHRLVWQHFYGDIPRHLTINHRNGIKSDNRPENLELVTLKENFHHAIRIGLVRVLGEDNSNAKLADYEIEDIRSLAGVMTQKEIAEQYEVDPSHISRIINGQRRIAA